MKLDIQKACPECKSNSCRRIRRKLWMTCLPKIKHYECCRCYKKFVTFCDISTLFEHRKYPRYYLDANTSLEVTINHQERAQLVDISQSGLSFLCPDGVDNTKKMVVDIHLSDLPEPINIKIKAVSKVPIAILDGCYNVKNKISGKFVGVSRRQKEILIDLIKRLQSDGATQLSVNNPSHDYYNFFDRDPEFKKAVNI